MPGVGLGGGREDRGVETRAVAEPFRQRNPAHRAALAIFAPAGAGEIATHNALDVHALGTPHELRANAQQRSTGRERRGEARGIVAHEMVRCGGLEPTHPERRECSQDRALARNRRRQDRVVRREPIARDDHQVVRPGLVDRAHLSAPPGLGPGDAHFRDRARGIEQLGRNVVACHADVHDPLLDDSGTENRSLTHAGSNAMRAIESTLASP